MAKVTAKFVAPPPDAPVVPEGTVELSLSVPVAAYLLRLVWSHERREDNTMVRQLRKVLPASVAEWAIVCPLYENTPFVFASDFERHMGWPEGTVGHDR